MATSFKKGDQIRRKPAAVHDMWQLLMSSHSLQSDELLTVSKKSDADGHFEIAGLGTGFHVDEFELA